ncbi:MAG: class I SAM-dependent methyltransferase [candidate division KSB1 bacterium]|nr:class I SAM-dependent methyltransferase [candidate division KSB1 bacterium]
MQPNRHLINWLDTNLPIYFKDFNESRGQGKRALVVGCGLGDDAEALAQRGFSVTAFDISPHAILWCQQRFPSSRVNYVVADLFESPREWNGAFALVVEIDTLQVVPPPLRPTAIAAIARYVANDGLLLVIARGREEHEDIGHLPWPLSRAELQLFAQTDLEQISFEEFYDDETLLIRRFKVLYRKHGAR